MNQGSSPHLNNPLISSSKWSEDIISNHPDLIKNFPIDASQHTLDYAICIIQALQADLKSVNGLNLHYIPVANSARLNEERTEIALLLEIKALHSSGENTLSFIKTLDFKRKPIWTSYSGDCCLLIKAKIDKNSNVSPNLKYQLEEIECHSLISKDSLKEELMVMMSEISSKNYNSYLFKILHDYITSHTALWEQHFEKESEEATQFANNIMACLHVDAGFIFSTYLSKSFRILFSLDHNLAIQCEAKNASIPSNAQPVFTLTSDEFEPLVPPDNSKQTVSAMLAKHHVLVNYRYPKLQLRNQQFLPSMTKSQLSKTIDQLYANLTKFKKNFHTSNISILDDHILIDENDPPLVVIPVHWETLGNSVCPFRSRNGSINFEKIDCKAVTLCHLRLSDSKLNFENVVFRLLTDKNGGSALKNNMVSHAWNAEESGRLDDLSCVAFDVLTTCLQSQLNHHVKISDNDLTVKSNDREQLSLILQGKRYELSFKTMLFRPFVQIRPAS